MTRINFVLLAIIYTVFDVDIGNVDANFELILDNITECRDPPLPFRKKRDFLSEFHIHKQGGVVYLSGQNRVLAEVSFRNFSIHSFTVDASGRQEPFFRLDRVNCRGWRGKLFLTTGGFLYNTRNCRLKKGTYPIKNIDLNKIAHTVPSWHATGKQLHIYSLVLNGSTVFCNEIMLLFKEFN